MFETGASEGAPGHRHGRSLRAAGKPGCSHPPKADSSRGMQGEEGQRPRGPRGGRAHCCSRAWSCTLGEAGRWIQAGILPWCWESCGNPAPSPADPWEHLPGAVVLIPGTHSIPGTSRTPRSAPQQGGWRGPPLESRSKALRRGRKSCCCLLVSSLPPPGAGTGSGCPRVPLEPGPVPPCGASKKGKWPPAPPTPKNGEKRSEQRKIFLAKGIQGESEAVAVAGGQQRFGVSEGLGLLPYTLWVTADPEAGQ